MFVFKLSGKQILFNLFRILSRDLKNYTIMLKSYLKQDNIVPYPQTSLSC